MALPDLVLPRVLRPAIEAMMRARCRDSTLRIGHESYGADRGRDPRKRSLVLYRAEPGRYPVRPFLDHPGSISFGRLPRISVNIGSAYDLISFGTRLRSSGSTCLRRRNVSGMFWTSCPMLYPSPFFSTPIIVFSLAPLTHRQSSPTFSSPQQEQPARCRYGLRLRRLVGRRSRVRRVFGFLYVDIDIDEILHPVLKLGRNNFPGGFCCFLSQAVDLGHRGSVGCLCEHFVETFFP